MKRFTKAIAAIMLMVAVVCAARCTKPDDPNDPNSGGNGSEPSPTTEGIYLGIIGFNYNLFPKEISLLDNSTKSSFTSFIDQLTTENLTALYYADYTALKKLSQFGEPPRLTNVALVTFTDGLDNASLDDNERNPENYPTREAYLNALHSKIKTEKIHGLDVNAYTIGLRGNDVQDVAAFQNNLKKLASSDRNVFEVTSMDEALQRFEEIAESLHWTSVTTSLTLLVPPGYDDGMVLRFTFDQVNSAVNSSLCIECTYKRTNDGRCLDNIHYIGFEQGASSLSSVEKLPNGFYKFVFEQLEKVNNGGFITEEDKNRLKLYRRISTGWEPETEFDNSNQSSIINEQSSALIMLVLDCTTSLGSQFSSLKTGAKNFVETLVNANSGGGNGGGTVQYTISVSANPTEGGTVSGGGSFNSGSSRTVSATANEGYTFTNWTENGSVVSTNANYTFTLNANRTLVANFTANALEQYTISISANPDSGGTVNGGGTFDSGTSCTVKATANEGYTFTNWTENDNVVSTNANYTFTVNANRTLKANFTANAPGQYTINVSANPTEGGTVSGGGSFNSGTLRTVTATANEGYTFINWTENGNQVSDSASYTFTLTANRTLVANFTVNAPNQYTISVSANPTDGGAVNGGGTYLQGQPCTVRATAAGGYTFQKWTENGNQVSTDANYTFNVTGNRSLVAHFIVQAPNTYSISASVTPTGAGTVTGAGTYQQGQSCTLMATAATGYSFQKWTKNGTLVSTNASYTFTVTENATYVAHFQLQSYTISTSSNPSSGGSTTGGGTYNYGQNCTLTAYPNNGYTFLKWTRNGTQVSTNASYTFPVTASGSYVAHFEQQSYNISVSANPSNGGTVSGGGIHYYGQSCTVHANAYNGYTFIKWTESGSQVSTNADYTFTVTDNRSLVAHFTYNSQAPTGAINGLFSVSATQQVWFSQGNLQFNAAQGSHLCADGTTKPGTWRFATNQWDYEGLANENIDQYYNGWIDLFGWGTSGWNCGNIYYLPWDSDNSDGSLYGPPGQYNLNGSYTNSDWGCYNAISNGGNTSSTWRTLTSPEWYYVFESRNTSSSIRYAKAMVNNVNGVILLPDNWSTNYYTLFDANSSGASFSSNIISSSTWTNSFQSHGAVFLPAAGRRYGTLVHDVDLGGCYWSASYNQYYSNYAWYLDFGGDLVYPGDPNDRVNGFSVRLVCPAQ